jgi:hypothetical protein
LAEDPRLISEHKTAHNALRFIGAKRMPFQNSWLALEFRQYLGKVKLSGFSLFRRKYPSYFWAIITMTKAAKDY